MKKKYNKMLRSLKNDVIWDYTKSKNIKEFMIFSVIFESNVKNIMLTKHSK